MPLRSFLEVMEHFISNATEPSDAWSEAASKTWILLIFWLKAVVGGVRTRFPLITSFYVKASMVLREATKYQGSRSSPSACRTKERDRRDRGPGCQGETSSMGLAEGMYSATLRIGLRLMDDDHEILSSRFNLKVRLFALLHFCSRGGQLVCRGCKGKLYVVGVVCTRHGLVNRSATKSFRNFSTSSSCLSESEYAIIEDMASFLNYLRSIMKKKR